MKYPKLLNPTATEKIRLPSGRTVKIAKATSFFKLWKGRKVTETYGGKTLLNFYRQPQFAELGILRIFERDGWKGVWVDTYRKKFRTSFWPPNTVALPKEKEALLGLIYRTAKSRAGCFDVFCWKGHSYIFVESKRRAEDEIRHTQKRWIQAAIKCGVPRESLLIIEWEISHQETTKKLR